MQPIKVHWAVKFLIILILGTLIAAWITGCASSHSVKGTCLDQAIYEVSVMSKYYETRIAYGYNWNKGDHCEAQAFIDGEWQDLYSPVTSVSIKKSRDDFIITNYYTLEEAVKLWRNREGK